MSITTEEELSRLQAAGVVARQVLDSMKRAVQPGVTTAALDAIGNRMMRENGAQSAPAMVYRFPGGSCISVNDEVVHGIPGNRMLADGDLVKLDVTIEKNGFMADTAATVAVGTISHERQKLLECAERAFAKAMLVARAGFRISEIGRVVEREVRRDGFCVVRDLCGHGIGRTIHESPQVPNYADPRAKSLLTEGLVITVEPIITAGTDHQFLDADGWTVRTADRMPAAHYEHTIVITKGIPIMLTA
jgi:methionyl aminopeptidase